MRKSLRARVRPNCRQSVALISLGCPKNLVDSEVMLASLAEHGFRTRSEIREADIAVVNTCSFLNSARQEAEQFIRDAVRLKRRGLLGAVVVTGCLPALRGERLFSDFPEVDAIVGPRDRLKISEACQAALERNGRRTCFLGHSDSLANRVYPRAISTGSHTAYLKIAEGCNNRCSYCLIPKIRGETSSRTMKSLVDEARCLAKSGVRELSIIAQDTTSYGVDLYGRQALSGLLAKLERVEGLRWIRLLYTHPAHWSEETIDAFNTNPKLCRYADVPIQHVSDKMLSLMRRRISKRALIRTLEKMRDRIPHLALRTTVMIGFPGEGEREFLELLEFMKYFRFDHLGAFVYSREENTRAALLPKQVPEKVKQERLLRVMEVQQGISRQKNGSFVGERLTVLVDCAENDGKSGVGRTQSQAPEVDGAVHLRGEGLRPGQFVKVMVTDFDEYDLFAEVLR